MNGDTGNLGGGVFTSARNRALEPKKATKHHRCQKKSENGLGKTLVQLWSRKNIAKSAHAGRGQQPLWGIPVCMPSDIQPMTTNQLVALLNWFHSRLKEMKSAKTSTPLGFQVHQVA
jgi:hypothetical protein